MTYTITPNTPKAASAAAFGRELDRALAKRDIGRNELWRATGIGRTALDNYRTGSSLPRTEAAAAIATVLDWPELLEIVRRARTRARQAGQTGDGRRRYQEVARLRSGIRVVQERSADQAAAIAAMCAACEPQGVCRTPDCPLRVFSPLPLAVHAVRDPKTRTVAIAERTKKRWTPAARARQSETTRRLHDEGRISFDMLGAHPAHDPARREAWLASLRAGKARRRVAPEARDELAALGGRS